MTDIPREEYEVLRKYLIFTAGDGLDVYNDLMSVFYDFEVEMPELEEIPHPYREYVKHGCRMVMQKIRNASLLAEEIR